jgi:hypothetical protein
MITMPWPKGKPRKGYVKPDGTPALKKGERIAQIRKDPEPYKSVATDKSGPVVAKGITGVAAIEPCPNCGYAYADGGYCPECDWTAFDPNCPHCTKGM